MVVEMVVGHVMLDRVRQHMFAAIGEGQKVKARAAVREVWIRIDVDGNRREVKDAGEIDVVERFDSIAASQLVPRLDEIDLVALRFVIAAELQTREIRVARTVTEQVRVDDADVFVHANLSLDKR